MPPFSPIPFDILIATGLIGLVFNIVIRAIKTRLQPDRVQQWQHWQDSTQATGQMFARVYRAFIVIGISGVVFGLITCIQFHQMAVSDDQYQKALSAPKSAARVIKTNASAYDCVGRGDSRRCVMEIELAKANEETLEQSFYLEPGQRVQPNQMVTLSNLAEDHYVLIDPPPLQLSPQVIQHYSLPIYFGLLLAFIGWGIRWARNTLLR